MKYRQQQARGNISSPGKHKLKLRRTSTHPWHWMRLKILAIVGITEDEEGPEFSQQPMEI